MIWADHAWILPAIPALAFLVLFAFGRFLPRGGDFISVGAALAVFVLFFFVLESHLDWLGARSRPGFRNVGHRLDQLRTKLRLSGLASPSTPSAM